MKAKIAIFGTFDTKGREFELLKDGIDRNGCQSILIDTGLTPSLYLQGDYIVRDMLASEGKQFGNIFDSSHRARSLEIISTRTAELICNLRERGEIQGVISMGGGQGTYIAGKVLRALPIGFPKLLLSTLALVEGSAAQFKYLNDTVVLNSLVDIAGINGLLKKTITQGAGAICGMARAMQAYAENERPAVAISAWGVTTPCVNRVRDYLDAQGFEPLVFHSNGEGGMVLESLARQSAVRAVVDITWSEESIPLADGALPFVPERLEGASIGRVGRVMAPGGVDMILARKQDVEPDGKFFGKTVYQHNPDVQFVRSNREENIRIGKHIAEKINRSTAPVKLLLPLKGVSAVDCAGQIFYDLETDAALFGALKAHITNPLVEIQELPYHINSAEFAEAIICALEDILRFAE